MKISETWGIMFSADNAHYFIPIIDRITNKTTDRKYGDKVKAINTTPPSLEEIKDIASRSYLDFLQKEFFTRHLATYGYNDIREFRTNGRSDLGEDQFREKCKELDNFDLGLSLIVYGFDEQRAKCVVQGE
jgi:hypothetical protein